jgi:hypothetical protein
MRPLLSIIALLSLPVALTAQAPAKAAPSAADREVEAIRVVYREVEAAIAAKSLVRHDTTIRCPEDEETGEPSYDMEFATYSAPDGTVRRFTIDWGTDDHAETIEHYYDAGGVLRFTFSQLRAVNGTVREQRVYWGADGSVVRQLAKKVKGPGYAMEVPDPVADPRAWLARICSNED